MNPNTIPWLHYQDIQIDDVAIRKQFNIYMDAGLYAEAIALLKNNERQLEGKAYVANVITTITDGILALESKFNEGVTVFLSDLAKQHMVLVDNLRKMGAWDINSEYIPYNFVIYDNEVYMNIKKPPVGTLPTNSTYWLKLGLRGDKGTPGIDATMKYSWDETRGYNQRDIVAYNGNLYIARKQNKGVTPGTDEATWLTFLSVSKGKINVGINPPDDPMVNTIWFNSNAMTETEGQFYRFTSNGEWEEMYPATLFTLVRNIEKYALTPIRVKLVTKKTDWEQIGDKLVYIYRNKAITNNSYIEIGIDYGGIIPWYAKKFLNSLEMEITDGVIKLSTDFVIGNKNTLFINIFNGGR